MYFEGSNFLHYKLADDLLKDYEIVLDNKKLCIKIDGVFVADENMIKRKMLDYDNTLKMKHINEVIRRLKLIAKPINYKVKAPPSTPTLLGERFNEKQLKVWCPFCKKYHIHGYDPEEKEIRRFAHCKDKTPFTDTGYIIIVKKEGG